MGRRPKVDLDSGVEDAAMRTLVWLGEQGVGAKIQVNAERMCGGPPAWTFAASGGPLDVAMRAGGASVAECGGRALRGLREARLVVAS